MKIKSIQCNDHPILGNLRMDFTDKAGNTLDTIVLAGINGSGKTTVLKAIWDSFPALHYTPKEGIDLELDFSKIPAFTGLEIDWNYLLKIKSGILYMPTEINIEQLKTKDLSYSSPNRFSNIVNQRTMLDIPSFLASQINSEILKNAELPAKDSINRICGQINSLFESLEIDAKLVGLSPETKLPIFKNSGDQEFDINGLSSGEKQLFVRALTLKMMGINNGVILVDEPEISMHPKWQQRIMKVYQSIGENNQVIAATHSPHVVASVKKESVKILKRIDGKIEVTDYNEIDGSYGLPVDVVLQDIMGLPSTRDPEIQEKIESLWDMIYKNKVEDSEFVELYKELEELLGSDDAALLSMQFEIAKRKAAKERGNAGNHQD